MRILFVYPEYPDTFWSFKHALKFIAKRAAYPPLGILTVAAMLPAQWEQRLIDMNVSTLRNEDIAWADYIFISAMSVQRASSRAVIDRCHALGATVVVGGPLFTSRPEEFDDVAYQVLNEAELTLPPFLADLQAGQARHRYSSDAWADVQTTPIPRWDLLNMKNYASMCVQFSRGCPFDCEFCDITVLYGRTPRTKSAAQVIAELDSLVRAGWRGGVFFVDDNFIGNKRVVKQEILPSITAWMTRHHHPFYFLTEASINLADDEQLMRQMTAAGFNSVFVGIETPNEESLQECGKVQNRNRDLLSSVHILQQHGLQVQGGFIVGFDSDDPLSIFDRLIAFIQESGIVTAMVGLLNAPYGSRLHTRMKAEGRLVEEDMTGNNTDGSTNFIPKMNAEVLANGYRAIVDSIYSPRQYYARVKNFLSEYRPCPAGVPHFGIEHVLALFKAGFVLGIVEKERVYYWRLLFWSLFRRPRSLHLAIILSIFGFHFRKSFEQSTKLMLENAQMVKREVGSVV